ncbi:MAG: hypothetical protein ACK52J_02635 [bacterium]
MLYVTAFYEKNISYIFFYYPIFKCPFEGLKCKSVKLAVLKLNLIYYSELFFIVKLILLSVFIIQSPNSILSSKSFGRFSKTTSSWKASPYTKTLETS